MQAVIIAGGLATRLGEVTKNIPKSLLEINGKPFLQYQLDFLKANSVTDVILCIGHLGHLIQQRFGDGSAYGVNIRYSLENKPLGTAGAIKNAGHLLNDIFFTIYGDSYFSLDFKAIYNYFLAREKQALMTVLLNRNRYDRSNTAVSGEIVTKYDKVNTTAEMVYIDYGLNLFRKSVLQLIPDNTHYGLEQVFQSLIMRRELLAYEVKERFYEIGSPAGLAEFRKIMGEKQ